MTERESEELYEDLRRKLEGYGSTPPPELWAAIQQQLPSNGPELPVRPVPRPALRRRWVLSLLLLLIGVVVGVLGIRLASQPETAALSTATRPTAKPNRSASTATPAQPAPAAQPATSPVAAAPSPAASSEKATASSSKAPATTSAATAAHQVSRETQVAIPDFATAAPQPRTADTKPQKPGIAGPMPAGIPQRRPQLLDRSNGSQPLPYTNRPLLAASRAAEAPNQKTGRNASPKPPISIPNKSARLQAAGILPDSGSMPAVARWESAVAVSERQQRQAAPDTTQGRPAAIGSRSTASKSFTRPKSGPVNSMSGRPQLAAATAVGDLLPQLPRASRLPQLAVAWPAVQPVAVAPTVARPVSRWAVELLAGPVISYRHLATPDSASLSRLERPALTFAGQLQVRYALTPRLSLSGGLGYLTYATRLNLLLQPARDTAGPLPTAQAVQQRDTYRFFTLPLQAQYQLGGQTRLRYGVAAGAAVELYAGGRTSGSTPCTCSQQQTWSATNSPYRRLGLSLTAGLDVRYALTPRLHLLVQPTGRYALISIVAPGTTVPAPAPIPPPGGNPLPPATTLPARHPFAAGLLTGFSFDLR